MTKGIIIALSAVTLIGASSFVATDCGSFEQFNVGVKFTTTSYKPDGTVISSSDATVKAVVAEAGKTTSTIDVVGKDAAGKQTDTSTFDLICDGGTYRMDLKSLAQGQAAASGMEVDITGDMLEFPSDMKAGQDLPGGTMTMKMHSGKSPMAITVNTVIKNRKCVAVENRTTPAGTWLCYKITSTLESSSEMSGRALPPTVRTSTEWFSFKVGMVRNETYKDGKLEGYRELTAFSKP